jgi:CubicO group peptidase (beta-lactamase class C family)
MVEGTVASGLERVREAFDAALPEELGAGFAAVRDGEVVVDLWGGWANREQTRAWAEDTIVPVYSTTKGVSALIGLTESDPSWGVTFGLTWVFRGFNVQ